MILDVFGVVCIRRLEEQQICIVNRLDLNTTGVFLAVTEMVLVLPL